MTPFDPFLQAGRKKKKKKCYYRGVNKSVGDRYEEASFSDTGRSYAVWRGWVVFGSRERVGWGHR